MNFPALGWIASAGRPGIAPRAVTDSQAFYLCDPTLAQLTHDARQLSSIFVLAFRRPGIEDRSSNEMSAIGAFQAFHPVLS
jgi:hypothetical protein